MSKTLAMVLAAGAAMGLLGVGTAQGQIDWNNPAGGSWHSAANWLPANEPDNAGEIARIALPGTYTVNLTASRTIAALQLFNSSASLTIANGTALTLSGLLSNNDGLITVNPTGGGNQTSLVVANGMVMEGSGTVALNATSGVEDRAIMYSGVGNSWTNGLNHTVSGRGRIYYTFTNDGTVRADVAASTLDYTQGTLTNNNLIQAIGGGIFNATGGTINQSGGGLIDVDGAGSRFNMNSTTIIGGTLSAASGGRIVGASGTQMWTGPLSVNGPVDIANGTGIASTGGLTHSGTILVNSSGGGNVTSFSVAAGSTLGGTGTLTLNASSGVLDRAELFSPSQAAWTHAAGHTINGRGRIYYNLINNGTISADMPAAVIELTQGTVTNNATMQTLGGGVLQFNGETVNQTGSGVIAANSGDINLLSATITGGTLTSAPGSRFFSASGTQTFNSVTLNGTLDIANGSTLFADGGLTHSGTITVNSSGGGSVTVMNVVAGTTLGGSGTVALNASSGVLDRAELFSPTQAAWTHAAGHTIRGRGHIYYSLVNNGLISADMPAEYIELTQGTVTNSGALQTAAGGRLQLNGETISQTAGGVVAANDGDITMISSTISGGTLSSTLPSRITGVSGTQTLTGGVLLNGAFDIANGTNLACPTGLTHTGTITINSSGGGSVTSMLVTQGTTLGGSGTVVLNATSGVLDRAGLYSPSQAAWTHAAGHTIRGRGHIYYNLINNGLISADMPAELIELTSGTVTNNAVLQTAAGGRLQLNSETINQGAGGIVAASNGNVTMIGSTITGGAITSTGPSKFIGSSGTQTLSGVTVNAVFDVANGSTLSLPTGAANNGTITINSTGGGAVTLCSIGNGAQLSGSGSIVLNATSGVFDRAYLHAPTGSFSNGNGHTIAGSGNVYATWTNHGNVQPSGLSRRIDCQQGAFTQAADGTLTIEMSANNSNGRLAGPMTKNLGGTLRVVLTNGYVPNPCDSWTVVTGPISGTFSAYDFPVLPGGQMHAAYTPTTVVVSYVPADYNGDGFPDFFDVDAFIECFEGGACPPGTDADFNHDGFVDFFDLDAFIAAFEEGC